MKRAGIIILAVMVAILLAGGDRATALEPVAMESGFSGFIRPGVGYMNYKSNIYYKNPWDWTLFGSEPINFYLGAAYLKTDSNIDFYDQEVTMGTVGLFFKW